MKNIILLAVIGFTMASCNKTEETTPDLICDTELSCVNEACIYTISNSIGNTRFLNCYGSWAIEVRSDTNANDWYVVDQDQWDETYEQEDTKVTFCGYVRENSLPLLLPDPMPGSFYQIRLAEIEKFVD